ncbi:unnamed protein product [Arabidopsis halleri]
MNKFRGLFVGNMRKINFVALEKGTSWSCSSLCFLVALAGQSVMLVFAPRFSLLFTVFAIMFFSDHFALRQ